MTFVSLALLQDSTTNRRADAGTGGVAAVMSALARGMSVVMTKGKTGLAVSSRRRQPYLSNGQLTLLLRHTPESASMAWNSIRASTIKDTMTGATRSITASYLLDATGLGDLLR